jgi:AcrR family transcriptional regulator
LQLLQRGADLDSGESLRERRRRQTRGVIAHAAMRLFAERGFDQVSVADIAAAADVAEKTVYNYFPVKAEMFFDQADDILAELLAAVQYRAVGQSALDAVATFLAGRNEWAAGRRPEQPTAGFRQLIAESAALQAQQRLMFARYETALANLLAKETGVPTGSVQPFTAAVALIGVLRSAFEAAPVEAAPVEGQGQDLVSAALGLLAGGLASYAVAAHQPGTV